MVTTLDEDKQKAASPKQSAAGASTNATEAIDPSSFYGKSASDAIKRPAVPPSTPPALPRRQQGGVEPASTGSQTNDAPPYSFGGSSYREPEVIPDEEMQDLSSAANFQNAADTSGWGTETSSWGGNWETNTPYRPHAWGAAGDEQLMGGGGFGTEPPIDGRDQTSERRWWEPRGRPGPGMLPPMATDTLHNPNHSLVSVTVTPPDIVPDVKASSSGESVSASPSTQQTGSPKEGGHARTPSIVDSSPTPEEIREAVPHPHAYYCRRHNGWVILAWRTSNSLPYLIEAKLQRPLPVPRPWPVANCLAESHHAHNKTHHFHRYQKVVPAGTMTPAYTPRDWERPESSKRSRRRITFGSDDLDPEMVARAVAGDVQSQIQTQKATEARESEDAEMLLDLYKCCQCQVYALVSDVIPGVIPVKVVDAFTTERRSNPPPGKTELQSVHMAWETVLM